MKVLLQRVSSAKVWVSGSAAAEIGGGVVLFSAFTHGDTESVVRELAHKLVHLTDFNTL